MTEVYWSILFQKNYPMYSAATDEGICYIGTPHAPFSELEEMVSKQIKDAVFIEDDSVFEQCEQELREYYTGERHEFTVPLALWGTDFQRQVWEVLQQIPYGQTLSYLEVAEKMRNPRAVRAVGGAIGKNPLLVIVPCHRVITKDGKLGGFRAGLQMKMSLLELEQQA